MGAIMIFGILGLGLLMPIGYPAMIGYVMLKNLFERIGDIFDISGDDN